MANATINLGILRQQQAGQRGYKEYSGNGAFPTTDATCTIPVPGLTQVEEVLLTAIGTQATDELLAWRDTLGSGLYQTNATLPVVTIGRTGSVKTSALAFSFRIRGR